MFGAGGGTSSYREAEETDLIVLWGSNARETHPIFFHHLLKGVHNGARLYAVDPRRTSSAEWADVWLGLDVGSDIALANFCAAKLTSLVAFEQLKTPKVVGPWAAFAATKPSTTFWRASSQLAGRREASRESRTSGWVSRT